MSNQYAGCRRPSCMPHAFNDLGYKAGMSQDLTFEDIDLVLASLSKSSAIAPYCHAIVLVFEELPAFSNASAPFNMDDIVVGMVTFEPGLRQIPDVYAFLHAVFNTGLDSATNPNSVLRDLLTSCYNIRKLMRGSILEQAASLQKAYKAAIKDSIWSRVPEAEKTIKPGAASQAGVGPDQLGRKKTPRFFVFVRSPSTGAVFLIDEDKLVEIARPATPHNHGVLCDHVVRAIASLRKTAGPGVESCAFALTSRRA